MKILRISSDLHPEVTGGLGLHVHNMSKKQSEMGHEVTVVTSDHGQHELPRTERRDGYTIRRHKELANVVGNSVIPGVIQTHLSNSDQYDVIHAHSHLFFSTNIVAALRYVDDTPLAITNHGLKSQTAPDWINRIYLPTVARFTLNAADRVFCYSKTDENRLRELGVNSSIAVINNGIDCSQFKPLSIAEDPSQILYVGRLTEGKGVEVLLEAFALLSNEFSDATLRIVGDGPKQDSLQRLAVKENIADRVIFAGRIPNDQLPALYNESAVFVLPSSSEGFPRTVIEAMACETPVVTTNLPQLRSIVEDVGRTVEFGSPELLADVIQELLADDTLRRNLGETARQRAVNQYSWTTTVEKTTHELRDLA